MFNFIKIYFYCSMVNFLKVYYSFILITLQSYLNIFYFHLPILLFLAFVRYSVSWSFLSISTIFLSFCNLCPYFAIIIIHFELFICFFPVNLEYFKTYLLKDLLYFHIIYKVSKKLNSNFDQDRSRVKVILLNIFYTFYIYLIVK
jgi:hypothetical protein